MIQENLEDLTLAMTFCNNVSFSPSHCFYFPDGTRHACVHMTYVSVFKLLLWLILQFSSQSHVSKPLVRASITWLIKVTLQLRKQTETSSKVDKIKLLQVPLLHSKIQLGYRVDRRYSTEITNQIPPLVTLVVSCSLLPSGLSPHLTYWDAERF